MSHKDAPPETAEQRRMAAFYTARGVSCGWGRDKGGGYLAPYARDAWAAWQEARRDPRAPDWFPSAADQPAAVLPFKVMPDPQCPPDEARFYQDGKLVGRITNIATDQQPGCWPFTSIPIAAPDQQPAPQPAAARCSCWSIHATTTGLMNRDPACPVHSPRAADQQFGCTTTGAGLVQPGHCPKCGWQWDHHGGYGHCPVTLADKSSDAPARRRDLDED
jgi:hypothetical protein